MADLPTYPLTREAVDAALAQLGDGSEDVAENLQRLGIKGVKDNDCACPLAVYLVRTFPDLDYAKIGGDSAHVEGFVRTDGFSEPFKHLPDLPDGAAAFVADFDQGIYPELVEEAPCSSPN